MRIKLCVVLVLLSAGIATAAERSTPRTPHEVVIQTYGLWYDNLTATRLGVSGLADLILQADEQDRGVLVRSQVWVDHFLVYAGAAPKGVITGANRNDPRKILEAAIKNKAVDKTSALFGIDIHVFWTEGPKGWGAGPWAAVSRQIAVANMSHAHEFGHCSCAGHDPAAGTGCRPEYADLIAEDGTCGIHGIGCVRVPVVSGPDVVYGGLVRGDQSHNNKAAYAETAGLRAGTNILKDPDLSCKPDLRTICLRNRFRVRVFWAEFDTPTTGWAGVSNRSFVLGDARVRVGSSSGTKIGIVGDPALVGYRVFVTDVKTGAIRAWQPPREETLQISISEF
jgi:hypothetical protein